MSLSTAESELIGLMNGAQAGEAIAALLSEILGVQPEKQLYGDNAAAISIVSGPLTSWRTRHLRLRALSLREKLEEGLRSSRHFGRRASLCRPVDQGLQCSAFCGVVAVGWYA